MERNTIVLICFLCLWSALTTNDLERSGLFCLGGYSSLSSEVGSGTQGRDLETRTNAEVIEKFCLPACSCLAYSATFLIQFKPIRLGMVLSKMG